MSKFLRALKENDPDQANYTLTLTLEDKAGKLHETLRREVNDHDSAGDLWASVHEIFYPIEDAEAAAGSPPSKKEMTSAALQNQAVMGAAQAEPQGPAGDAVRRRALRVKDAIKSFEKQTREMG